jgi:hypothetical protein
MSEASGRARARGIYADEATWNRLLRLTGRHGGGRHEGKPAASAFMARAVDAAEAAKKYAGDRDPWDWIAEAIERRAAIPPGGIMLKVDIERMTLAERARLQPDETRLAIARAWLSSGGRRELAIQILGVDEAQWIRAQRYLPGLSEALRQICSAVSI